MAYTPYMTSTDLVAAVKRKISFPVSQNTFTEQEILDFCNEEMMMSQVPSVLQYHEEYFGQALTVSLVANVSRYAIPERAIGQKFRDLFYVDSNGNLSEMTRIDASNKAYFDSANINNTLVQSQYYLQGNEVVIVPGVGATPTGSIQFDYFLRPNQLVENDRAAIISSFSKTITVTLASLVAGDTITIGDEVFTAVASGAGADEFNIGVSSDATASNLSGAITTNGVATASVLTNVVTCSYSDVTTEFDSSNDAALAVQATQGIIFTSVPDNITDGSVVDFLQTKSGHKTRAMDVTIPTSGVSGTTISFVDADVPDGIVVGDYICLANECIIPQIPTDLHNALAERACSRILSALGDKQGLDMSNQKLQEIEVRQGTLLDNRVTNAPTKVLARKTFLRYNKVGRRWW